MDRWSVVRTTSVNAPLAACTVAGLPWANAAARANTAGRFFGTMSPQWNTIVRPQAESNRRAQFCRLLPQPLGHAVMRGLRTIRTSACFLGGSHAVLCTMSHQRFQQDSNLRCRLRGTESCPLDHGSIVRCSRLGLAWGNGVWLEGCPQVKRCVPT